MGGAVMAVTFNASTSSGLVTTADNSGQIAFQSNGTQFNPTLLSGTSQASTSGTSIDFTSIPSWVKRITVMLSGVSTSGTSQIQIQIGSGSFTATGYLGIGAAISNANFTSTLAASTGWPIESSSNLTAASARYGNATIANITGNTWTFNSVIGITSINYVGYSGGSLALSGTLDRVRITTVNGTDTFDAGTINILYE